MEHPFQHDIAKNFPRETQYVRKFISLFLLVVIAQHAIIVKDKCFQ
jgi:hypothetical protein